MKHRRFIPALTGLMKKVGRVATTRWADVKDKFSPQRRAEIKREANDELDRMGYAALRKARELTQVELARKLGLSQSSVAGIEARTDLQLSTLAKYIKALGGELEVRAVWPGGSFNLLALPSIEAPVDVAAIPKNRAAKKTTRARPALKSRALIGTP